MHVQVLSSGSAGNATLVRAGDITLLIDAGLPLDELEARLEAARVPLQTLDAIAVTHGHLDHARSAGVLSRKSGARLLAVNALFSNASLRPSRAQQALRPGEATRIPARRGRDELVLIGVPVPHDADPTLAFRIEHAGRTAVVCTDLGSLTSELATALADAHYLLLEFNHDELLLANGPYAAALKKRVGGARGHLSNDQAAQLLEALAGARLETLVLAHLSATNNRPELARQAAQRALERGGWNGVRIEVAEQGRIGPSIRA